MLVVLLQLEESNKTLTKDVENLSKEKTELDEKIRLQEEGEYHRWGLGARLRLLTTGGVGFPPFRFGGWKMRNNGKASIGRRGPCRFMAAVPTLFLEVGHPGCFHFYPNLAHLILFISSSIGSRAEYGELW